MKINRLIYSTILVSVLFGMQACQDMDDNPAFNYPQGSPDPTGEENAEKLLFDFDADLFDKSSYQFMTSPAGTHTFVEGVKGKAVKGGENGMYMILNSHPAIVEEANEQLVNLGAFTVAFWMNSGKNKGALSLFSITHKKNFWSNLDIYLENNGSPTEAFFKVQVMNYRVNKTAGISKRLDLRVADVFESGWVHMAFTYDADSSTLFVYRNGVEMARTVWADFGRIKFKDMGPMIIGTFPFQADPSLTTGTGNQGWAKWYDGALDQFHFYSEYLPADKIVKLFQDKE